MKSYEEANHPPQIELAYERNLRVKPGATISLSAKETSDPDGDTLTYRWWQYHEADTANTIVAITSANSPQASFIVPSEPGNNVHIVLEVTDDGTPRLTRYERIIYEIK